jgi:hypothetical protein
LKQFLKLNPIKFSFNVPIVELYIIYKQVPLVKILRSVDPFQLSAFRGLSKLAMLSGLDVSMGQFVLLKICEPLDKAEPLKLHQELVKKVFEGFSV